VPLTVARLVFCLVAVRGLGVLGLVVPVTVERPKVHAYLEPERLTLIVNLHVESVRSAAAREMPRMNAGGHQR
jgi:hypothetical protein